MTKPYEKTLETAERRMRELRGERRVTMETLVDELKREEAIIAANDPKVFGYDGPECRVYSNAKNRAGRLKTCLGHLLALWSEGR